MPDLTLDEGGLAVDGVPLTLPCDVATLIARFGRAGRAERLMHGIRRPFPASAIVALENLHAADKSHAVEHLTLHPDKLAGTFTIEGVPHHQVKFRSTQYGPEKRVGGWMVAPGEDGWSLYPDARPKKKAPKPAAGQREAEKKAPAKAAAKAAAKKPAARKTAGRAKAFDATYPEVAKKDVLRFVDRSFKLAVIEMLMFEKKVLKPAFDLEGFVAGHTKRAIDLSTEGYDAPIREVLAWFEKYPVDRKHAPLVRKLVQHPGSVLHAIYPQWTGEDDTFVVESAEDAKLFPALSEVTLFSKSPRHDAKLTKAFAALGVKARF